MLCGNTGVSMASIRRLAAFAFAMLAALAVSWSAPAPADDKLVTPPDRRLATILEEHNRARAEVGSPPLQWDPALAAGAAAYASQLTARGRVHASREGRKDIRENLLQSLRGQRSPREMVGVWIAERRHFRPGVFPHVSATGNWADVGHYTQIIWPTTTRLGCAIHSDARYDWTVCRYSPPGNRDGSPIGFPPINIAQGPVINVNNPPRPPVRQEPPGGQDAGDEGRPANDAARDQDGGPNDPGQTTERPPQVPVAANPEEPFRHEVGDCKVSVTAKIRLVETEDPDNPNKVRREKEPYNLLHGFTEIVVPHGWDAKPIVKPDADGTGKYTGTMTAIWGIADGADLQTYRISGNKNKLKRGRWDSREGVDEIKPPHRPTGQVHRLWRQWDPDPPTDPPQCEKENRFTVTFAGPIPPPPGLDLVAFVNDASSTGFAGSRGGTRTREGTRTFHSGPRSRTYDNGDVKVLAPIGIFWDLEDGCCNMREAEREVIQFARAAIHGPNGHQGKGWGLDILPTEMRNAPNHDPTYTGQPNSDGNDTVTPHGSGGTATIGKDVLQWDAPGMPKDLFDRLHAAQGQSVYRQQFLSLLVCRPGSSRRVRAYLDKSRICQIAVTTIRWDFPGQRGIDNAANYRPPRITVSFDMRDGNCINLRGFLNAHGLLGAFQRPSDDARNLETLDARSYEELKRNVDSWENSPFAEGNVNVPAPPAGR